MLLLFGQTIRQTSSRFQHHNGGGSREVRSQRSDNLFVCVAFCFLQLGLLASSPYVCPFLLLFFSLLPFIFSPWSLNNFYYFSPATALHLEFRRSTSFLSQDIQLPTWLATGPLKLLRTIQYHNA